MNAFKLYTTSFLVLQLIFIVTFATASPLTQSLFRRSQQNQLASTQQPQFLWDTPSALNVDSSPSIRKSLSYDLPVDSKKILQTEFENSKEFLKYFLRKDSEYSVEELNRQDTPAEKLKASLNETKLQEAYKTIEFRHYSLGDNSVLYLENVVNDILGILYNLRSSFDTTDVSPFPSNAKPLPNHQNVRGDSKHPLSAPKYEPPPLDLLTGEYPTYKAARDAQNSSKHLAPTKTSSKKKRKQTPTSLKNLGIFYPNDTPLYPNEPFDRNDALISYLSYQLTPYQEEALAENNYKNLMYKLQFDRVYKHFPGGIPEGRFRNDPDLLKALKHSWALEDKKIKEKGT